MDACASQSADVAALMVEEQHSSSSFLNFYTAGVELSKHHWSELSEAMGDGLSCEVAAEAKLANLEAFKIWELHPEWSTFFKIFGDHSKVWGSYGSLEMGEKFAEGAQAELFHACVQWTNPKMNELDLEYGNGFVLKVFKEGSLVRDLERQWHEGLFRYRFECHKLLELGKCVPKVIAQVVCATLLEDGRFAFLMVKEDGDLRSLIDLRMAKSAHACGPFLKEVGEEVMYRVAKGVEVLHEYNIVHRDLKASNVLVTTPPCGTWVYCHVADFESSVGVVGTGFWRAPEVLRALREKNVGKRPKLFSREADSYSYGMTCYEVLTGRVPFEDHPLSNKHSLLMDLVIDHHLRPEVPDYVEDWARDLLDWCWKPTPEERPSFKEIMGILEANSNCEYIQVTLSKRLTNC